MSDVDNYLANYSYALIGCGVSVFVFFIFLIDVELSSELFTFISLESLFLIVGGVGVRFRHKVGYYIFVSFLSILFFHFPVGTYFAHKTFNYLKENNIKDHFFRKKKSKP